MRGHLGGVGGHVLAHRGGGDLRVVHLLLLLVAAQVGHAHQLDAALEGGEVGQLLEGAQVLLVGRGDEHLVELQHEVLERHLRRLAEAEQVLEGLERALEQVRVLDEPAVGVHERAVGLEERHVVQRRRQVEHLRAVGRDLVVGGVHAHLRLHRHRAHLVAARDVEALDLHVAQHLEVVALVVGEQRRVDAAALVAHLSVQEVVGEHGLGVGGLRVPGLALLEGAVEEALALGGRQDEERVVAQLARDAHVDGVGVQVRVGGQVPSGGGDALAPKAHGALDELLRGEDPAHAVERALGLARVVLHAAT